MASPPGDDAIVEIAAHHDAALEVALTAVDHIVAQSACILHEHYLDARIPSIVASDVVAALLVTIKVPGKSIPTRLRVPNSAPRARLSVTTRETLTAI